MANSRDWDEAGIFTFKCCEAIVGFMYLVCMFLKGVGGCKHRGELNKDG